ncbi:nickel ABC transporter, permease protein [Escherichia coli]|nr:nickel ABC transporter, permease protein [Escherichia coli]
MNFFLSSRWSVRLALIIIALLALIALTSQWWLPYDPQAIDLPSRLLSPDAQHWLGTDHLGRDIFSRLMAATRVSLGSVMACPAAGADIRASYWRQRRADWRAR